MSDGMVASVEEEQVGDDSEKAHCLNYGQRVGFEKVIADAADVDNADAADADDADAAESDDPGSADFDNGCYELT